MEYSPQQPSSPEISENAVERPEQKLLTTFEKVWKVTTDPESIEALSQSDDYLPGFLSFLTGSLELIPEIPESAAEREMLHAIIDRLKPYCLDPGSRRKAKYDTSRVIPLIGQKSHEIETLEEKPIEILNRSAFITKIIEHFGYENIYNLGKRCQFKIIDLKGFREADRALDSMGRSAADLVANRVSGRLVQNANRINIALTAMGSSSKVVVGRYGGDEYCVGLLDFESDAMRNAVMSILEGKEYGIKSLIGYFRVVYGHLPVTLEAYLDVKDERPAKEKASEPFEYITPPIVPDESEIAQVLSRREGNLQRQVEQAADAQRNHIENAPKRRGISISSAINRAKADARKFGRLLLLGLIADKKEIDQTKDDEIPAFLGMRHITDQEARFAEIKENYPELLGVCNHVERLYKSDNAKYGTLLTEFNRFLESSVYDRLLGDKVTTFYDFMNMLENKEIKTIHMIDLKAIKELNDGKSMAFADGAIRKVWERIYDVCERNGVPRSKVFFSRRGGTFMIGERFGLPKEIDMRKILSEIQSIELTERKDGKTSSYTFHLANCSIDPDYENKTKEQIIGECFTKTDQAWFRKMAQLIIDSTTEISLDQRYRGQYDIKSYLRKRNDEPALGRVGVLANNFFKLYLLGKRKEERCTALVAAAC